MYILQMLIRRALINSMFYLKLYTKLLHFIGKNEVYAIMYREMYCVTEVPVCASPVDVTTKLSNFKPCLTLDSV